MYIYICIYIYIHYIYIIHIIYTFSFLPIHWCVLNTQDSFVTSDIFLSMTIENLGMVTTMHYYIYIYMYIYIYNAINSVT